MIQKPNINFTDAATISMKESSPIFQFFQTENQSQLRAECRVFFTPHVNTWYNNQIFCNDVRKKWKLQEHGQFYILKDLSIESKNV